MSIVWAKSEHLRSLNTTYHPYILTNKSLMMLVHFYHHDIILPFQCLIWFSSMEF